MRYSIYLILLLILHLSCKKTSTPAEEIENKKISFNRILILGNSITFHKPEEKLDWKGNWGMAASARDSDYVHILERNFKISNPQSLLKASNISKFENEYDTYNFNELDSIRKFNPDLLIIRIGENINLDKNKVTDFSKYYLDLIKYFKNNNQSLQIICVSNFWFNPLIENKMKACAETEGAAYVSLSHLDKIEYTAWGLFTNPAVGSHPGNKGMKAIADLIWSKTIEINNKL